MSRRARLAFFAVAAAALAVTLGAGLAGLPSFGSQLTSYARMLNELAPRQRHVTDVVSAITFDYRGIDTLFEEFVLLGAVQALAILCLAVGYREPGLASLAVVLAALSSGGSVAFARFLERWL